MANKPVLSAHLVQVRMLPSLFNRLLILAWLIVDLEAASVHFRFSGSTSTVSAWPVGTDYQIEVNWDPSMVPVFTDKGSYDKIYDYSSQGAFLKSPGIDVEMFIGADHFRYSSSDVNVGRATVNLIDQPGSQLDRFTLWMGEPNLGWDFLQLEFASVSNDALVDPGSDWRSVSFDFSGDYVVTRVRYHHWGGTQNFNDDMGDVTLSVIPEMDVVLLSSLGFCLMLGRRVRNIRRRE